jgi:histidyl-tRNA synthetase
LCADCRRRLTTNVWRILDCKSESCRHAISSAPAMTELVGAESRKFFDCVCRGLDALGLAYELEPRLVRGLDYYVHTVFEVVHPGLGAQDAIAGGGRYSITLPGGSRPVDGVGFAAGMERLLLARQSLGVRAAPRTGADVFVVSLGEAAVAAGLGLAQALRAVGLRVVAEVGERSMRAQLRTANRLGARLVLIQGETELARAVVTCKNMATSEQVEIGRAAVPQWVAERLRRA